MKNYNIVIKSLL